MSARKMRDRNGYAGPFEPCAPARVTVAGMRGVLVGTLPTGHALVAVRNPFAAFEDGPRTTFVTASQSWLER